METAPTSSVLKLVSVTLMVAKGCVCAVNDPTRDFEAFVLEIEFWCDKEVVDAIQEMTLDEALPIIQANMRKNQIHAWSQQFRWYLRPVARWIAHNQS